MLSRNPVMHHVFAKLRLAEERGMGLASMQAKAQDARLPAPVYSFRNPYVELELFRRGAVAAPAATRRILDTLTEGEREAWKWMVTRKSFSVSEYRQEMGIPIRTAKFHLLRFTKSRLLRRTGAGPATRYQVMR